MAEYVCLDGRMSVNGICPASSYPGYQKPAENIVTPLVTNNNQNVGGDGKDYSKDVKSTFEWDFDKVGNKVENFTTTVKDNITAYDKYVADKFGISAKSITLNRTVGSAGTLLSGGGSKAALGPWALAYGIGAFVKKKIQEPTRDTMSFKDPNTVDFSSGGDSWTDDKSQSQGFGSDAASMSNVSNEGASGSFTTDFSKD